VERMLPAPKKEERRTKGVLKWKQWVKPFGSGGSKMKGKKSRFILLL
jgi:hypothetical protein